MAITKTEAYYRSDNGSDMIRALIWRDEEKESAGVVQLVHGVSEHIGRYDEFARFLAENGFIKKLNIQNGVVNYDKTLTPHEHCVCEICGRITDFKMDGLAEELADCLRREISGYELTVRTICDECAKKRT